MQQTAVNNNLPEKPRRKKFLKYTLISIACFLAFILLAAVLIPVLFEGQVKKIFLKEINKQIATEIVVDEDDIELTVLKNFPEATVVLHNIGIRESIKDSKKYFLLSDEISLVFNVRDILKGNYVIKKIEVKNADVTLLKDEKGNINYKFWKETGNETTSDVSVLLQAVKCKSIAFIYTDKKNNQDIHLQVQDAKMSGNFNTENYLVSASGNILSQYIKIGKTKYLINRETETKVEFLVNTKTDTYTFHNGNVKVADTEFAIEGSITDAKELLFDLAVQSKDADIEALLLLIPGNFASRLNTLESKGDITFQSTIKGIYSKQNNPLVNIDFAIENGEIYHKSFGDKLTNVYCKGSYTNGEKQNGQTSSLSIKHLSANYGKEPLTFDLLYKNFSNPFIDLQLNGNIPAFLLLASAQENVTDAGGYISFHNVEINGNVKTLNTNSVKGDFAFHAVNFKIRNETISITNGSARLENSEIILQDLQAKFFGTEMQATVTLNNWLGKIFSNSDENNPPLFLSGNIRCNSLNLYKLIETFSREKNPSSASGTAPSNTNWMNISGSLQCSVEAFQYKQLNIKNVKADVKLSPGFIGLKNFTGNAMQGDFSVQTTLRRLANENYLLEVIGILNAIDIEELFQSFNNFTQTTLTDKNIKGKATTYIENINMQWDKNYKLLENSIYCLVNLKIEQGELNNYKPLETLSKFVNVSDLQNISFATMQNQIEIRNRTITIPAMQIRSSALNVDLSGTHTFDNVIDYQVALSLADLLANKFFGKNKNKENYEQDDKGGINIYVSMTGTVDKPIIQYNKREAQKKMSEQGIDKPDFLDIFKPDAENPQQKHDLFNKQHSNAPAHEDADTLEFIEWDDE